MARAKLLRQYIADKQKEGEKAYATYQGDYAGYKENVDAYNSKIAPYNEATKKLEYGDIWADENGILNQINKLGKQEMMGGGLKISDLSRRADGSYYIPAGEGEMIENPKWTAPQISSGGGDMNFNPGYGQSLPNGGSDWQPNGSTGDTPTSNDWSPNSQAPQEPPPPSTEPQYIPHPGITLNIKAIHPGAANFTAPEQPRVNPLNFTPAELRELATPGMTPGQIEMARAKGYYGNPALVGQEEPTKNSAFAELNPDAGKGILERTLAGTL